MLQLNPKQTRNAVEACLLNQTPIMLWGAPGIGKSDIQRQITESLGALLIDVRLSQYDSVDLRGIPTISDGFTTWNPPTTMPFVGNPAFDTPDNQDRLIVLFLDEILQALPAVQSVAFQLVLDRAVGEHALMPNVRVIAASNRETDRAGANRMLTPLANRFTHVEMVPALDPWREWAWEHELSPEVIAFISFRPDLLSNFDAANGQKVFASPRTWAYVDRFVKQGNTGLTEAVRNALIHGAVGTGPATEFISFMDVWQDMPNPEDCIAKPKTTEVPPKSKPATMFAITAALAARADKDNFENIVTYVSRLPPEYAVRCVKDSIRRTPTLAQTKTFIKFATDNQDLLRS